MFAVMEELLTWAEKLEALPKSGKIKLTEQDKSSSIYSAIFKNYPEGSTKVFSIRTIKGTDERYLIRIK